VSAATTQPAGTTTVEPEPTTEATDVLAGRVAGHGFVYFAASAAGFAIGIASIAVVTRMLDSEDFGRLAVVSMFASLVTVVANTGSLQGALSLALGSGGDEGDVFDEERADPKRRPHAIVAGLVLTFLLSVLVAGVSIVFAGPLSDWLLRGEATRDLVVLGAAAGGATALWRLSVNVLRIQRRAVAYLVASVAHPTFQLVATVILLAAGRGLEGAVLGMSIGSVAATVFTLAFVRDDLRMGFSLGDVVAIYRRGWTFIPIAIGIHVIQLTDAFFLSRFVSFQQVGLYRAASRIGGMAVHSTSAFTMAWGTMRTDPAYLAAEKRFGRESLGASAVTYFAVVASGVVLFIAVFAQDLVRIAAPSYASATQYIPLAAVAAAAHGVMVITYFVSEFKSKRVWYAGAVLFAAAVFAGSSLVLIPAMGPNGVSLGILLAFFTGAALVLARGQRGPHPVPFQIRRLLVVVLSAGASFAAAELVPVDGAVLEVAVDVVSFLAYAGLLLAFRIVTREDVRTVATALRRRGRGAWKRDLRARIEALDPEDRRLLTDIAASGTRAARSDDELLRFAQVLRGLARVDGADRATELELAACLASRDTYGERHAAARALFDAGVDPLQYDRLDRTLTFVRRQLRGRSNRPVAE